jgi:hypothetical protein
MTTVLLVVERHLDDHLLAVHPGQQLSVTIQLLSTSTGAVLHNRGGHRVAELSVTRLPRRVDSNADLAAMAHAHASLKLDREWVADKPRGDQPDGSYDRLIIVEFRPAGGLR